MEKTSMCASRFENKILNMLTEEELEKFIPLPDNCDTEDDTFTCKELIVKIWDACVLYGYISQDYDVLGRFLVRSKWNCWQNLVYSMPRRRKHCPICGKRNLAKDNIQSFSGHSSNLRRNETILSL